MASGARKIVLKRFIPLFLAIINIFVIYLSVYGGNYFSVARTNLKNFETCLESYTPHELSEMYYEKYQNGTLDEYGYYDKIDDFARYCFLDNENVDVIKHKISGSESFILYLRIYEITMGLPLLLGGLVFCFQKVKKKMFLVIYISLISINAFLLIAATGSQDYSRYISAPFWLIPTILGWSYILYQQITTSQKVDAVSNNESPNASHIVNESPNASNIIQTITELANLHKAGILSDAEFEEKKAALLKRL